MPQKSKSPERLLLKSNTWRVGEWCPVRRCCCESHRGILPGRLAPVPSLFSHALLPSRNTWLIEAPSQPL